MCFGNSTSDRLSLLYGTSGCLGFRSIFRGRSRYLTKSRLRGGFQVDSGGKTAVKKRKGGNPRNAFSGSASSTLDKSTLDKSTADKSTPDKSTADKSTSVPFTSAVYSVVDLPPQNDMPTATDSVDAPAVAPFVYPRIIAMPRPSQPGAVEFNNMNVTEFLNEWERFCTDYRLSEQEKVERLPSYCSDLDTRETVKLLSGYAAKDWKSLRSDLRKSFRAFDNRDDTMIALCKLIKMDPKPDLRLYVLKYTSISAKLVAKGMLSSVDCVAHFIDGLDDDLRRKALQFCLKNK